jgi:hypothetical protein
MTSEIIIENISRHFNYAIILDGRDAGEVFPLKTHSIVVEPGTYELSFKDSDTENLPTKCKPIEITIAEGRTLPLKVTTRDFSIRIYDEHGTHLNGKRGFLCGTVADGIHIDNPIT